MKLTFTDTETTGLPRDFPSGDGPEITEYAFATWEDGRVSDELHRLIMPEHAPKPDSTGTVRVGGKPDGFPMSFRPDEWKRGGAKPWSAEDNKIVFDRIHGKHIAGSNPRFDVDRFRWEIDRFSKGGPRFEHHHRVMDLNAVGFPLWAYGLVESTGLVALAAHFGIEHDAHTSAGDVAASIAVFERCLDEFMGKPKRMREFLEEISGCFAVEGEDGYDLGCAAREVLGG